MIRILWIVNIAMPDACKALGLDVPAIGGWLTGYQQALSLSDTEFELHVLSPFNGTSPQQAKNETTHHHLFPQSWEGETLRHYMTQIRQEVKPDVVHIFGTEMPHSLAWVEACGTNRTLVSIQGMTSVYWRYYKGGLTDKDLRCSFADWRHGESIGSQQAEMEHRGQQERRLLSLVSNIAGRTEWDRAHTWALAPQAHYYTLQEPLRAAFYDTANRWNLSRCQRHTLFVSQATYPIKGLHMLLEALPLVLRHFPDTKLLIGGYSTINRHWWQRPTYANYLRRQMKRLGLSKHVKTLGLLDEKAMVEQLKKAHIFVCPSAIENSSNSIGEAQLMGVPVVASYVGGTANLVEHGVSGHVYRYEETEMLAEAICRIFANDDLAASLSQGALTVATKRHDPKAVSDTLLYIYKQLLAQ